MIGKYDGEPDGWLEGSLMYNADSDLEGFCDGSMIGKDDGELDR